MSETTLTLVNGEDSRVLADLYFQLTGKRESEEQIALGQKFLDGEIAEEEFDSKKDNPNHDELGRFTFGDDASQSIFNKPENAFSIPRGEGSDATHKGPDGKEGDKPYLIMEHAHGHTTIHNAEAYQAWLDKGNEANKQKGR